MIELATRSMILAVIFTQVSCYTFVSPNLFGQSLSSSSRVWPNIAPYQFRTYQPSIQQYLRYYGEPYYHSTLPNPSYYFPHDSYDDGDAYYSNVLYYFPTGRQSSYYERTIVDPTGEMSYYEDDSTEEDNIPESQKDSWSEKTVDTDISQFNRVDDQYGAKNAVSKTGLKQKSKSSSKNVIKTHGGVNGFDGKKDQNVQAVHSNYRSRTEEPVYGKPVHYERVEDSNVRDLKLLLKNLPNKEDEKQPVDFFNRWASGKDKRDTKENLAANTLKAASPVNIFSMYDEGGHEIVKDNKWNKDYAPEQTSIFDTIKTLLALEDGINDAGQDVKPHKLLKRKPPVYKPPPPKSKPTNKNGPRTHTGESKTDRPISKTPGESSSGITERPPVRTNKRSVNLPAEESPYNNGDALVRELSAVRHQAS